MGDDRTYIKLHDGMPGHPKVRGLSDKAFRTLVRAWCYCSEYLTDGEVVTAAARDLGTPKAWAEIVASGLAESAPGGYLMHDYLQHQRSAQQIEELKEKRRAAGRLGGRPRGSKPKASANQVLEQVPKQNESKNNPETESLTNVRDQAEADTSLRSGRERPPVEDQGSNAGQIVGLWIDTLNRRPPGSVVGQVAKHVKSLLTDGFAEQEILDGLATMSAKGLNPSTLPSLVNDVVNRPKLTAVAGGRQVKQQLGQDGQWHDITGDEWVPIGTKTRWVSA